MGGLALRSRRRSTLYLASAASCSLACLACGGKEAIGMTSAERPRTQCDLTRVRVRAMLMLSRAHHRTQGPG